MDSVLHIIGLSDSPGNHDALRVALENSVALVSSKRLYQQLVKSELLDAYPPLYPVVPLAECISTLKKMLQKGDVTFLASGDPLFFGIGRLLTSTFLDQEIRIHPGLSSMQVAFSRFNIPWDDARFVSLHGRSNALLASRLLQHYKTFVFTDPLNSPDKIATALLAECGSKSVADVRVFVAEYLGDESERLISGSLSEIASQDFADLNVMILITPEPAHCSKPCFGLQEQEITHSRGLITKNEVRAAAIHALRFPEKGVFWDVGAGSGAIGLEVARLFPEIQVFSVEREKEQWQNILINRRKFATWNLSLIQGEAPGILGGLRRPDRIFIGGSGGNLKEILTFSAEKLLEDGVIVVNAVIQKTAEIAPQTLYSLGFDVEIREIAVQRKSYPEETVQSFNPIKIIVGRKKPGFNR